MGKLLERRAKTAEDIPELLDGDSLELPEYLRRYEASKTVARAELLDGIVHVNALYDPVTGLGNSMSPISLTHHGAPQANVIYWLKSYSMKTPGTQAVAPVTIEMRRANSAPEPDAILYIIGGQTRVSERDWLIGTPELVVEVSHATKREDLTEKKKGYFKQGVSEFIVIRTADGIIDWFVRDTRQFTSLSAENHVFKSLVFPGLRLNTEAFLAGDLDRVVQTLDQGLASAEHSKFVKRLAG